MAARRGRDLSSHPRLVASSETKTEINPEMMAVSRQDTATNVELEQRSENPASVVEGSQAKRPDEKGMEIAIADTNAAKILLSKIFLEANPRSFTSTGSVRTVRVIKYGPSAK